MRPRLPNGLVLKFLLVFVAVFLIPTTYGFWELSHYDTYAEMAKLTARIGNQMAQNNVRERLKAFFGTKAELEVRAERGRYAVHMSFPYRSAAR